MMSDIDDWATNAARDILHLPPGDSIGAKRKNIAALIIAYAKPLVTLLNESRRTHHHNSLHGDTCCPECSCQVSQTSRCNCGAAEWNARVDEVLAGKDACVSADNQFTNDQFTNDPPQKHPRVRGRCPSCGSDSLFLGAGGYVTCSVIGRCKEPGAAYSLLEREDHGSASTVARIIRKIHIAFNVAVRSHCGAWLPACNGVGCEICRSVICNVAEEERSAT